MSRLGLISDVHESPGPCQLSNTFGSTSCLLANGLRFAGCLQSQQVRAPHPHCSSPMQPTETRTRNRTPGNLDTVFEMPEHCWNRGHSSSTSARTSPEFAGVPTSEQSVPGMFRCHSGVRNCPFERGEGDTETKNRNS